MYIKMLNIVILLLTKLYEKVCIMNKRCSWGYFTNTLVIHSFIIYLSESSFVKISVTHFHSKNRESQGAEILREGSHPPTCHMSCVTCHVSHVICHMKHVTFHMSHVIYRIFLKTCSESSQWRVCYQWATRLGRIWVHLNLGDSSHAYCR